MDNTTKFSSHSKEIIENFSNNVLNKMISLNNVSELSEMLNSESEIIKGLSSFLGSSARDMYFSKFYDSLNIFEKHGFIKASKKKAYELKSSVIATSATAAVPIVMESISYAEKKYQLNNFAEFFLGWMSYVNQSKATPQLRRQAQNILSAVSVNPDKIKIDKIIDEYSTKKSSQLPHLSSKNFTSLNHEQNDMLSQFAKEVLAPCDLSIAETKERALEFMEECFGINYYEAQNKISDVLAAQHYHTDSTSFSTVCFMTEFIKFAGTLSNAYEFGKYNEETDVCVQKIRQNQNVLRRMIEVGGKAVLEQNPAVLLQALQAPARRDLLDTSSGLMQSIFNSGGDAERGMDLMDSAFQMWKKIRD